MKRKIIGISVCMLVIATAFLSVTGTEDAALVDKSNPAHLTRLAPGDVSKVSPPGSQVMAKGDILFIQLPHDPNESWSAATSDQGAGYKVYEDFWGVTTPISDIHWWGLALIWTGSGWTAGDPNNLVFDIEFYSDPPDDPNLPPTELVCTYQNVVPPVITGTGQYYAGFELYFFDGVELSPSCNLTQGWVSIQSKSGGQGQDWLMWMSAKTGDGLSCQEGGDCPRYFDQALILTGEPEECDWQPGDPHKMHFPQLPDEDGWDVNATYPVVLADDWMCSDSGWVKDIHFWGSWKHGNEGTIIGFWLSIHSNIPGPPSMPGETLWERYVEDFNFTPIDPPTMEGWYDPSTGEVIPNDHQAYFQYNICLDEPDWFWQDQNVIYWLNISAVVEPVEAQWGWKSSEDHFMDDAVWAYWGELDWVEIYEPGTSGPIMNHFWIEFGPDGMPIAAGGTDYYDDGTSFNGWYYYYMTNWWNIWFYNAPFDFDRYKDIFVHFDWFPTVEPWWIEVALNWATPDWPPGGPPPLPDDQPEQAFIWREYIPVMEPGMPVDFWYTIDQYNPEWVSMDVMGANILVEGIIEHQCLPAEDTVSLDLAFVITGGEECTPSIDVEKKVWDEANQDWVDSTDIDSCTNAEFRIRAHNDGTCCDLIEILVSDCMDSSLDYQYASPPPDLVEPYPGGVCLEWYFDGPIPPCSTIEITITAHAVGPVCHLDTNYVGANGFCESTGQYVHDEDMAWVHITPGEPEEWPNHKMHYPQLPDPMGWDVVATMGYVAHPGIVVADDFMCTKSVAITDIHFWGSWLDDYEVPILGFWLSIHSNIPSPPAPWSMPGEELWSAYITDFEVVGPEDGEEGWYDPFDPAWWPFDHFRYYRYDITFIEEPFFQDSGTIYWLNIMADLGPPGYMGFPNLPLWGWKTSLQHWEDDAVWSVWMPPAYEWLPLYDPETGITLDMAFVITGPEVLCGDVNNDGVVELGDIVYLINYVFRAGPVPMPYECVGDVNNDNVVELGDIVYLINYVFKSGPPPNPYCCTPPWKAE